MGFTGPAPNQQVHHTYAMETASVYSFSPEVPWERLNVKLPGMVVPGKAHVAEEEESFETASVFSCISGSDKSLHDEPYIHLPLGEGVLSADDNKQATRPEVAEGKCKCNGRCTCATAGPGSEKNPAFRLRRRGRLANSLASAEVLRKATMEVGGKTSLCGARLWIEALRDAGAKVVERRQVHLKEGNDELLVIESDHKQIAFSLGVYSRLAAYACYKPRTRTLVAALRSRAVQFSDELGHSPELRAWITPGTVALAMVVLPHEEVGYESMAGALGARSDVNTKRFDTGDIPAQMSRVVKGRELKIEMTHWSDSLWPWLIGGTNVRSGRKLPRDSK